MLTVLFVPKLKDSGHKIMVATSADDLAALIATLAPGEKGRVAFLSKTIQGSDYLVMNMQPGAYIGGGVDSDEQV